MEITLGANIRVSEPTDELKIWAKEHLVIANPEYTKKVRLGFSTYNTPERLWLYETDGDDLILPFGVLRDILPMTMEATFTDTFPGPVHVVYKGDIPLRDYQEQAVEAMYEEMYGILQSPPGSGKTQMGIALIAKSGRKALWLTHTKDLLDQSRERAEKYFDPDLMGEITEGRVEIGKGITFATVQTMANLDLTKYRDVWDVVIVDECHRVSGSPTAMSMFYKVLNNLAARNKYGLSATVHRSDGMIQSTYAILGSVVHIVPDSAVADNVMKVTVEAVPTGCSLRREAINSDGTLNYSRYVSSLSDYTERNNIIVGLLKKDCGKSCLVLSDRVDHLEELMAMLPISMKKLAVKVDGKMTTKALKAARKQAIEDMRKGQKKILFATFSLAKEGLDIPRLERLYLTTPHTDYAVIAQSIGRIARTFPGKCCPVAYDFVDYDPHSMKYYGRRKTTYRKAGCEIVEVKV